MRPVVSAVIATYNFERFIGRALDSVLAQDWPAEALDIVVVDDGSTDGTPELLRAYTERHPNVRYIRKENGGHLSTFNAGIGAARGDYIALLDGDDEWLPGKIAAQVALLEARPEVGLVHGDMTVVDGENRVLQESFVGAKSYDPVEGRILGRLMRGNVVTTSAIMVRASLRERFHPLPSWSRVQDWWISVRVSEVAEIAYLPQAVTLYRSHGGNLNLGQDMDKRAVLMAAEIPLRRWMLTSAETEGIGSNELLEAYQALESTAYQVSVHTGRPLPTIAGVDKRQKLQGRTRRGAAFAAAKAGDDSEALRQIVAALAFNPYDQDARRELGRIAGRLLVAEERALSEAAPAPTPAASGERVDGARAFATLADAAELAERPELLAAYGAAFTADDDATLVITLGDEPAELERLQGALEAAGLDGDDAPDLLAVPREPRARLAGAVDAVLSAALPEGALAALPAAGAAGAGALAALHRPAAGTLRFCVNIAAPHWNAAPSWGDLHFARAIQQELARRGHPCAIHTMDGWDATRAGDYDVVLHLKGLHAYEGSPDHLNVLWSISHPDLLTIAECDAADLVLVASESFAAAIAAQTRTPVAVLDQATDPEVFLPERDRAHARELVFVGNSRNVMRRILADLLPTERDLAIWGGGWDELVDPRHLAGTYLPNDQVRRAYASAGIVLNDHWDDMREHGFLSNRLYDAVAAGGFVISDHIDGIEERFGGAVVTYRTADELHALVEHYLANPRERAERAAAGRELVLARHTFAHRVDDLLARVGDALDVRGQAADVGQGAVVAPRRVA
jgi:hypothetical protein